MKFQKELNYQLLLKAENMSIKLWRLAQSKKLKKLETTKYEDVEDDLLERFNLMKIFNLSLTGLVVQEKTKQFSHNYGDKVGERFCFLEWL